MEKSIPGIMNHEHARIKIMLEDVENNLENLQKAKELFNIFKWNLEKHFFVEEKVIFTIYGKSKQDEDYDIFNLLKEHKDMLWIFEKIENSFINSQKPDLTDLKEILDAHATFESKTFYPRLEEELSHEEKQIIIDRAEEIVRG